VRDQPQVLSVELPDPVALGVWLVPGLILGDQDVACVRLGRDDGLLESEVECDTPGQRAFPAVLQEVGVAEVAADAVLWVALIAAFRGDDPDAVKCGRFEDAAVVRLDERQRAEVRCRVNRRQPR
jgi:hypothetical protein